MPASETDGSARGSGPSGAAPPAVRSGAAAGGRSEHGQVAGRGRLVGGWQPHTAAQGWGRSINMRRRRRAGAQRPVGRQAGGRGRTAGRRHTRGPRLTPTRARGSGVQRLAARYTRGAARGADDGRAPAAAGRAADGAPRRVCASADGTVRWWWRRPTWLRTASVAGAVGLWASGHGAPPTPPLLGSWRRAPCAARGGAARMCAKKKKKLQKQQAATPPVPSAASPVRARRPVCVSESPSLGGAARPPAEPAATHRDKLATAAGRRPPRPPRGWPGHDVPAPAARIPHARPSRAHPAQ